MKEAKIRKANIKDIDSLLELYVAYGKYLKRVIPNKFQFFKKLKKGYEKEIKKDILRSLKDKKSITFVFLEGKKIVGMISGQIIVFPNHLFVDKKTFGYLQYLFVDKKYRGKSISKKLKEELFKWFKKRRCDFARLEVATSNPARKIYHKWGFEEDAVKMMKELK